nr:hypothetical protein [uncultured Flavobacterium sp.]
MEIFIDEQLAGIKKIEFFLLTEVGNWPVLITDNNANQLVFSLSADTLAATVDEKTISDKTKRKQTNSGDLFEVNLEYNILTRSKDLEQMVEKYQNKRGVAIVSYYNGFKKIFGTNEEPIFLSYGETPGSTIDDKASVDVSISGVTRTRPAYYLP